MRQILTFLLTMTLLPMLAFGQQGLFQYTEERAANLTTNHVELLETLQSKPPGRKHLVSKRSRYFRYGKQ
ncbi:MAG: hypothetical protein WEA79_05170 [Balneolaceae bacterium]